MTGILRLAVLGHPEIQRGNTPLAFTTRKAAALLIYLMVERRSHAREELLALLWPESDSARARASLRTTLTFVRNALAAGAAPTFDYLLADGDALAFNPQAPLDLDVETLEAAARLSMASTVALSESAVAQLQRAVASYRGDFLAGFGVREAPQFDDWAAIQREAWHRRMSLVYDRLSQWQAGEAALPEAIDTAARWVAHDRFNEAAHRRLITLHFTAGDRSSALQAYASCEAVLRTELAAEPSPDTRALLAQIRAAPPITPRTSAPPTSPQPAPPAGRAGSRPGLNSGMVGRAAEHERLTRAWQRARQGTPQAVVVLGEAGMGKTRLVHEFIGWAAAGGGAMAMGQAFETGGRVSYQTVVEALRSIPTPPSLSPVWLAELSLLLPELRQRWPSLPEPARDESTAQTRLFEAVAQWGCAAAAARPFVLFFDDVQWADSASLDLLRYAARQWRARQAAVLLLVALRSSAVAGQASALADWLAGLEGELPVERVELSSLTGADTRALVAALTGDPPAGAAQALETFTNWLFEHTAGHPFYMVETLKALLDRGLLAWQPAADGGHRLELEPAVNELASLRGWVPTSVRDVIRARLARLRPPARNLLAAGAVLGQELEFESLAQVAGLDELQGLAALDELLGAQLLQTREPGAREAPSPRRPAGGSPALLAFAHDRIRDVAYTEIGDARRRVLHKRALDWLANAGARPGNPRRVTSAALAYHALQAGQAQPAFRYSLAAGQEALRVFAVREALAHLEQARAVAAEELGRQAAPEALQELYSELGRAHQLAGQPAQAEAVYEGMLALGRERGSTHMMCSALNHLATLVAQGPLALDRATALLHEAQALAASPGGHASDLAETEWNLAQVAIYGFDLLGARLHAQTALALAQDLAGPPDPRDEAGTGGRRAVSDDLIARSLNGLAYAELGLGQWAEAAAHSREAAARYGALGNAAMEADSLGVLANVQHRTGRTAEALASAHGQLAISTGIDNAWGQMHANVYIALVQAEAGRLDEALAAVRSGLALAEAQAEVVWWRVMWLVTAGRVYRARLELSQAQSSHEAAWRACQGQPLPPAFVAGVAAELCADAVVAGDWPGAAAFARQAVQRQDELLPFGFDGWPAIAALAQAVPPESSTAQALLDRLGTLSHDNARYQVYYARGQAALCTARGEFRDAIAALKNAVVLAGDQLDLPGEVWQLNAALGEQYLAVQEPALARQAFAEAGTQLRDMAASFALDAEHEAFRAAGPARRVFEQASM